MDEETTTPTEAPPGGTVATIPPLHSTIPPAVQAAVIALRENGFSLRKIHTETGVSVKTILKILKIQEERQEIDPVRVEQIKKEIGSRFLVKASNALEHITPEKLAAASPRDCAVISGICHDHHRLEADKSTENVAMNMSWAEMHIRAVEAVDKRIREEVARKKAEQERQNEPNKPEEPNHEDA
jgi:hypothetical protein